MKSWAPVFVVVGAIVLIVLGVVGIEWSRRSAAGEIGRVPDPDPEHDDPGEVAADLLREVATRLDDGAHDPTGVL